MTLLASVGERYEEVVRRAEAAGDAWLLGSLARLLFLAVLAVFFWQSALTKLGTGLFDPSRGAYFQVVPWAMEAAAYNPANLGFGAHLLVLLATWAEFLLPLLVVLGLFTRLASLGMIGFILVMTLVDLAFHGLKPEIVGTLFDNRADGLWDRRLLWIFLLAVLVLKGPGPVSLDRLLGRLRQRRQAGGALTRPEGSPRGS